MNGSPATCWENRVHRAHNTHRSRSSSTCVDSGIGLGKVRLTSSKRDSARPIRHRLVLQRAFAALVAHRAVQGMVDQQQLHHTLLRLVGDGRRELGVDDHAVGDGRGAGSERLALPLHVDEALTAGADRIEQRVVAKPRDLNADHLRGTNHQRALGNTDLDTVDDNAHCVRARSARGHRGFHARPSLVAHSLRPLAPRSRTRGLRAVTSLATLAGFMRVLPP